MTALPHYGLMPSSIAVLRTFARIMDWLSDSGFRGIAAATRTMPIIPSRNRRLANSGWSAKDDHTPIKSTMGRPTAIPFFMLVVPNWQSRLAGLAN